MSKYKRIRIIVTVFFAIVVLVIGNLAHEDIGPVSFENLMQEDTIVAAPELIEGTEYVQKIPCLFARTKSVGFFFANYSNRMNAGNVHIQISSNNEVLGEQNFNASEIGDGVYLYVPLSKYPNIGDELTARINSNSESGHGVTIWCGRSDFLMETGAALTINKVPQELQLRYSFTLEGKDPQLSVWFVPLVCLAFIIYSFTGIPEYYLKQITTSRRGRKLIFYCLLLIIGTMLLCLRNIEFIATPVIYGEDGLFLSRQLNQGLLRGFFSTRGGESADFSQTSAYILTWLAAKTTAMLHGYSLAEYPFWMGIYGNLSFAFAAVLLYRAFELMAGKGMAVVAYTAVIFMNLWNSSSEVLGRILNTGFLWVIIVAAALVIRMIRYEKFDVESLFEDIICFIGAFSFPICFLEIALYLGFVMINCFREKHWKTDIQKNGILLLTLLIGIYMLPRLLTSGGGGVGLEFQAESTIEFFLARHILFPFVWPVYHWLSDGIVIFLFVVYMAVVLGAMAITTKEKGITNPFALYVTLTLGSCFASAYMRRTMTAFFNHYTSSYPDRYYYACNILTLLLGIAAIIFVLNELQIKKHITNIICISTVLYLCCQPYLFNFTYGNYGVILGSSECYETLVDSCKKALKNPQCGEMAGNIIVNYSIGWNAELPLQYVIATANDSNIR